MQVEERRGLWTTFGNLNQWFDGSKECLVHLGFAEDEPMKVIDMFAGHDLPFADLDKNLVSELTFKYGVLHRIINFDETHDGKDSEGDRGGSRVSSLTNPNLPRPGGRYAKDPGNHVSGCYGATPLEPMPPCIVYNTMAKTPDRMRRKLTWTEHLPIAMGVWGLGGEYEMDTHVAVRKKGSYEEDLFIRLCLFYCLFGVKP